MWSAHDPVTLFGAAAPSRSGWDQVEPVFRWLASRFAACNTYDLELVAAGASGDLAYTVAHEHYEALTNDGSVVRTTLRATHVYRREGGEWKIDHPVTGSGRERRPCPYGDHRGAPSFCNVFSGLGR
jgi:ketosteroid isomerase-like protein